MGKTLTSILEIGAIIGLQFIPGVGQAVSGFLAGAGISVSAAQGLLIATVALAGAETILNSTILAPNAPKARIPEQPLRSPTPPRKSGYGPIRMQPTWILYETADSGYAVDCYAFHDGQISRVLFTYIGDKRATATNGGYVQPLDDDTFGKNGDNIQIGWNLGLPTEVAFSEVVATVPEHWTANHRGDGVVTGFMLSKNVKSKNWGTVYSLGGPNQAPLSLAMEAQLVYDWRDPSQHVDDPTSWKYSANFILALAHYLLIRKDTSPPRLSASMTSDEIAAERAAYLDRIAAVWAMKFEPNIALWTAAADDADSAMPLKGFQTIMSEKANHGDASVTVDSVNGLHNGMEIQIFVSGNSGQTETKTVTSLTGNTINFSGGLANDHPKGSQVTWTSDPANPATEPRYQCSVTHAHNDPHKTTIANLLACGDGLLGTRPDGSYTVYSGSFIAPTVSVGAGDILDYSLQYEVNPEDSVNTYKVTYVSANHDWSVVDTDDWVDTDRIDRDGKEISDSFQPSTPSFSQNRRLAKRAMAKRNAPFRGQILISGRRKDVAGERYIDVDLTEAGDTFYSGPVELSNGKRIMATGAYQYDFVSIDASIDAWNPATEEGNPAPVGNRVAAQPVAAPTITAATPNFGTDSGTGTQGVFLDLTIDGVPNRDDLTWYARTRVAGAATWGERTYTDIAAGTTVDLATEFVPADAMVEVEVSFSTGDGKYSDWSATTTVNTSSANIPPAKVTGLAATPGTGQVTLTWNNPNSATLAYEKLYRSATSSFGGASIVDTYADPGGTASSHVITEISGTWYYFVTTISSGGAEGNPVGPVSATVT